MAAGNKGKSIKCKRHEQSVSNNTSTVRGKLLCRLIGHSFGKIQGFKRAFDLRPDEVRLVVIIHALGDGLRQKHLCCTTNDDEFRGIDSP